MLFLNIDYLTLFFFANWWVEYGRL